MSDLFSIGFLAGLALAIPVGPMAIMLVNTTISRGWRHGASGALGMASVDFGYALLVFLAGRLIHSWLSDYGVWLGVGGALILLFLGAQTLIRNLRLLGKPGSELSGSVGGKTIFGTYSIFVGATVMNPPTALYFLAIAPNLSGLSSEVFAPLVFALGVFIGSLIWQEGLALAGIGLRQITSNRIRPWIGAIGGLLIIALAVKIAVDAIG
jgi:threonine/homoserine/homoserine lactone efflux protein